jgi:hypothetical protein
MAVGFASEVSVATFTQGSAPISIKRYESPPPSAGRPPVSVRNPLGREPLSDPDENPTSRSGSYTSAGRSGISVNRANTVNTYGSYARPRPVPRDFGTTSLNSVRDSKHANLFSLRSSYRDEKSSVRPSTVDEVSDTNASSFKDTRASTTGIETGRDYYAKKLAASRSSKVDAGSWNSNLFGPKPPTATSNISKIDESAVRFGWGYSHDEAYNKSRNQTQTDTSRRESLGISVDEDGWATGSTYRSRVSRPSVSSRAQKKWEDHSDPYEGWMIYAESLKSRTRATASRGATGTQVSSGSSVDTVPETSSKVPGSVANARANLWRRTGGLPPSDYVPSSSDSSLFDGCARRSSRESTPATKGGGVEYLLI